jgi:hypothetical protein
MSLPENVAESFDACFQKPVPRAQNNIVASQKAENNRIIDTLKAK